MGDRLTADFAKALVRAEKIGQDDVPDYLSVSFSGVDAVVDYLDHALDWMADNTPNDTETLYLEATVTYYRNARGPYVTVIRSHDRELGGP